MLNGETGGRIVVGEERAHVFAIQESRCTAGRSRSADHGEHARTERSQRDASRRTLDKSPRGMAQHYCFRYCCDMTTRVKYREIVREIALDHYGYVTTREAADAGVPTVELPKLAARGGLVNVAYGIYRVPDIPPTVYDQFAEALLRAGEGSYLHGESVLALFGLADVNPRRIKVAVRRRSRSKLPPFVELTQTKDDENTTFYEGLAAQPVANAILNCRGRIERDRLLEAAKQARVEGLLNTAEWRRVRKGLQ